jgi:hypothetical protein
VERELPPSRPRVTNCVVGRVATLLLLVTAACGSEQTSSQSRGSSRIEAAIEKEFGERVHVPVRVRCVWIPPSCRVTLPDSSQLPLRLGIERGALSWRLDGALVLADDIEAYLRDALVDLGAPQVARCGARIRSLAAGDRVQCQLQNGGKAFVVVNADGTTAIEIDLDPIAGDARAEAVSTERDQSLLDMSRKLEHANDDEGE